MLLALLSALPGLCLASLMQFVEFRSTSSETLSELSYRFQMQPGIALATLGFALFMGYAGGLLPAIKAARAPIAEVLHG